MAVELAAFQRKERENVERERLRQNQPQASSDIYSGDVRERSGANVHPYPMRQRSHSFSQRIPSLPSVPENVVADNSGAVRVDHRMLFKTATSHAFKWHLILFSLTEDVNWREVSHLRKAQELLAAFNEMRRTALATVRSIHPALLAQCDIGGIEDAVGDIVAKFRSSGGSSGRRQYGGFDQLSINGVVQPSRNPPVAAVASSDPVLLEMRNVQRAQLLDSLVDRSLLIDVWLMLVRFTQMEESAEPRLTMAQVQGPMQVPEAAKMLESENSDDIQGDNSSAGASG